MTMNQRSMLGTFALANAVALATNALAPAGNTVPAVIVLEIEATPQ